jgi:hypothetical protein
LRLGTPDGFTILLLWRRLGSAAGLEVKIGIGCRNFSDRQGQLGTKSNPSHRPPRNRELLQIQAGRREGLRCESLWGPGLWGPGPSAASRPSATSRPAHRDRPAGLPGGIFFRGLGPLPALSVHPATADSPPSSPQLASSFPLRHLLDPDSLSARLGFPAGCDRASDSRRRDGRLQFGGQRLSGVRPL